jgi:hypothetical protein
MKLTILLFIALFANSYAQASSQFCRVFRVDGSKHEFVGQFLVDGGKTFVASKVEIDRNANRRILGGIERKGASNVTDLSIRKRGPTYIVGFFEPNQTQIFGGMPNSKKKVFQYYRLEGRVCTQIQDTDHTKAEIIKMGQDSHHLPDDILQCVGGCATLVGKGASS